MNWGALMVRIHDPQVIYLQFVQSLNQLQIALITYFNNSLNLISHRNRRSEKLIIML